MTRTTRRAITTYVEAEDYARLVQLAAKEDRSLADVVRVTLRRRLAEAETDLSPAKPAAAKAKGRDS